MKIENANHYIDMAASEARGRYISTGIGQGITYFIKSQQAKDYAAAGYTGTVPGFIQAEVEATGMTAQQAADYIIATESQWEYLAILIEKTRRTAKVEISTMTDPMAVSQRTQQAIDTLNAI